MAYYYLHVVCSMKMRNAMLDYNLDRKNGLSILLNLHLSAPTDHVKDETHVLFLIKASLVRPLYFFFVGLITIAT